MGIIEQDFVIQPAFQERIWQVGIEPPIMFASGKPANNKVNWEGLFRFPEDPANPNAGNNFALTPAGQLVAGVLLEIVDRFAPDAVGGVPQGGQRFGRVVARELGVPFARAVKIDNKPGLKTYDYATEGDKATAMNSRRFAVVEDATTELTSTVGYLALVQGTPGEREVGVRAIHRRDDGSNERLLPLGVSIDWVIELPMPNMMTAEHPTYQRWGHLAVGQLERTATAQPARV